MSEITPSRGKAALVPIFISVWAGVTLLIIVLGTLVTFILPESYVGISRVRVEQTRLPASYDPKVIQTEIEVIRSESVLRKVIEDLNLNAQWGTRYAGGILKTSESLQILKSKLEVEPVINTSFIKIQVFCEEPSEAATIANAIARICTERTETVPEGTRVIMMDAAHPSLRPARPNKPLNMVLSVVCGILLGLGSATVVTWVVSAYRTKAPSKIT